MKKLALLLSVGLLSLPVSAYNPSDSSPLTESTEITDIQETEYQQFIDELFGEKMSFLTSVPKKCKIIIIDSNFNTVREECVENMQNICNHSTLVPIIYRSEFIVKINQVSYFMLNKK